ncbi:MAG: BMP family lipoprotein [Candidatus Nanopelagicus sp.]
MAKRFAFFSLILSLVTSLSLANAIAAEPKKIAIAYDVGGRGDNGLNDLAAVGLERAIKKLNISRLDVREQITDGSLGDRITRVRFLAKNKYQLIICVGSGYADTVRRISNEYPNTQFAIIDDESVAMTNVSNLSFATEEAIYLAAAAMAVKSKSGKIGFIASKTDPTSAKYASVFAKGAMAGNSKVKIFSKLTDSNFDNEVKGQVDLGVDQLFSTWSNTDEVISTVAKFNSGNSPILFSGILPDQYFLNFSAGKKNQYLVVLKRYDLAVEQIITAELADKNILNILDSKKGIYGNRYNLKDGGLSVKVVAGTAFSAKIQGILANLKAGRVKNLN